MNSKNIYTVIIKITIYNITYTFFKFIIYYDKYIYALCLAK